jgi:hypothetical protein
MQAIADEAGRRGYEVRESRPRASRITEFEIVIRSYGFAVTISDKGGKLRLWLPDAYEGRRQWNDGPRGLTESKLADMLASLEERTREAEERQLEREDEERRREEARQRAVELARERCAEAFRADVLKKQVADRRLGGDVRRYCGELRELIEAGSAPPETREWVEWAEAYADAIDPLAHPPAMPEVPEPKQDDLRPFLQELGFGGYPYW